METNGKAVLDRPTFRTIVDSGDPSFSRHHVEVDFGNGWIVVGVIHEDLNDGGPAIFRTARIVHGETLHLATTSELTDAVSLIVSTL